MINFKLISPSEAIEMALTEARSSAAEITKLANTPLAAGETPEGQALKAFRHAINLAAAFNVLEQIADLVHASGRDCPCPDCEAKRHNDSPQTDLPKAGVSSGIN